MWVGLLWMNKVRWLIQIVVLLTFWGEKRGGEVSMIGRERGIKISNNLSFREVLKKKKIFDNCFCYQKKKWQEIQQIWTRRPLNLSLCKRAFVLTWPVGHVTYALSYIMYTWKCISCDFLKKEVFFFNFCFAVTVLKALSNISAKTEKKLAIYSK